MSDPATLTTERFLLDAGLLPGMRVLDIGCGRGDVSFLAARLVGEQGQVVGVDRDPAALAFAREGARELGLPHVSFVEGDFGPLPSEHGLFDAVVGRRVLMYQPDALGALRRIMSNLAPGGLLVFQEHDSTVGPVSLTPLPLHARVRSWIWQTVEREGADVHMGFRLAPLLQQAGLEHVQLRAEAAVQAPSARLPTAGIVRAMLSRMVQQGVTTEAEVDLASLEQRLADELQQAQTTYLGELVFGVWGRKTEACPSAPD
jgi:SAM-dependent methyltransferase